MCVVKCGRVWRCTARVRECTAGRVRTCISGSDAGVVAGTPAQTERPKAIGEEAIEMTNTARHVAA